MNSISFLFQYAVDVTSSANRDDADIANDSNKNKYDDDEADDDDDESFGSKSKKPKPTASSSSNQIDTSYYDYLINMTLRNFTKERREEILKEQKEKHEKLDALKKKSPEDLYEDDLLNFENEYKKVS